MNKKYIPKEISWLSLMNVFYRKLKIRKYPFWNGLSFLVSIPIILMNISE